MPRPCSICARADVEELDALIKRGRSAKAIARERNIGHRMLTEHFRRHRGGLLGNRRGGIASQKVIAAQRAEFSSLIEAKALHERVLRMMDKAEADGSQKALLVCIRESRGCLELLARLSGELSPAQNAVQINVGVSLEQAKLAVAVVDEADALSDSELADRAVAMLEDYNASHPDDAREVRRMRLLADHRSDGPAGGEG